MREAQLVWPELQPFVDDRATSAAKTLGLPSTSGGRRQRLVMCCHLKPLSVQDQHLHARSTAGVARAAAFCG